MVYRNGREMCHVLYHHIILLCGLTILTDKHLELLIVIIYLLIYLYILVKKYLAMIQNSILSYFDFHMNHFTDLRSC